jgi:hypothetical protein
VDGEDVAIAADIGDLTVGVQPDSDPMVLESGIHSKALLTTLLNDTRSKEAEDMAAVCAVETSSLNGIRDAEAEGLADVAAAPATASVDDFISSISSNLSSPILSPPGLRVSQVPDYTVVPDDAPDDAIPTPPPKVDPRMLFVNSLRLPLSEALVRTPLPALPRRTP